MLLVMNRMGSTKLKIRNKNELPLTRPTCIPRLLPNVSELKDI